MSSRHLLSLLAALPLLAGCAATPMDETDSESSARGSDAIDSNAHFTLWLHGRNASGSTTQGDYGDFSYWGPAAEAAGVNARAVNWDGRSRISESNAAIRRALDCFCTGESSCAIAAHSAGDAQIGYVLAFFGGTGRDVTDGVPDASGACKPTGETQVGWNVRWVDVAGGASGGTELADLGYWAVSDPLTSDLRTGTARSLYDHGETQGVPFYMFAGAKGTAYSGVLPGQDDEVVPYHSSGALSAPGTFCNPGDWFCDDALQMGDGGSKKKGGWTPKWANHEVAFRDDGETHDHYTRGGWGGIVSPMAEDVAYWSN